MDVAEWLRKLGLEQYAPGFLENHIGEELLADLSSDDLKELGVASLGHRRRLLAAIAALRVSEPLPRRFGTNRPHRLPSGGR
jgi:hypothetical protein